MTKYTKMLVRFITISTYAIIFCIIGNMIMPALVVESVHAQAVTSAQVAQAQSANATKKALDKIQSDVNALKYKDMGLTQSEIVFAGKNDMDALTKKIDTYVSYDKNGNAKLNEAKVVASKLFASTYIGIVKKQITKYNETVNRIDKSVLDTKKLGASSVSASASKNTIPETTKTVLDRGIKETIKISTNTGSGVSAMSFGANGSYIDFTWLWGGYAVYLPSSAVDGLLITLGATAIRDAYLFAKYLMVTTVSYAMIAVKYLCASNFPVCIGIAAVTLAYAYYMFDANRACGGRGVYLWSQWTAIPFVRRVC